MEKTFILTPGYSATRWLMFALRRSDPDAFVVHEPLPHPTGYRMQQIAGEITSKEIVSNLIKDREKILDVANDSRCNKYVEINHRLYAWTYELREAFPGCKIVGWVRNAKTFVPSNLGVQKFKDRKVLEIDVDRDAWDSWSNIERTAYLWRYKIEQFYNKISVWRMEDILFSTSSIGWSLWTTFLGQLNFLENYTSIDDFEYIRSIRLNKHKKTRGYKDYTKEEKEGFWRGVGYMMERLMYE